MNTTPPHPPALLAAWAAHNGWPLDDERMKFCHIFEGFRAFKAGYEAHAATAADALAGLRASLSERDDHDFYGDTKFELLKQLDATIKEVSEHAPA